MDTHTSSPHGHPTTRRLSDPPSQQSSTQRRQGFHTTTLAHFTPSPQHESRVNVHQRRLQLRNSAFGTTQLSAQRLGARFSKIFHGNEEPSSAPPRDRQQENRTPNRASLRNTQSSHSLRSSLGILSEISNSTHVPSLRKRAPVPIYEDNPERPLLERSPATPDTQYHDASSNIQSPLSPLGLSYAREDRSTMRLRTVSGNEQRRSPSYSSPLSSTNNKGRRRTTDTRHSSFEAAEYIDHIEKQLEQVKQAMHSPGSGKPIHEKMKTLKSENVRLKRTIEGLESSFEARVKNSVEHMTAGEGELRRKIRLLEEELRDRDVRIEELEYEHDQSRLDQGTLDTLKTTIERLEGEKQTLEGANRSIEKRNDMLTELLAFSPTKLHHSFEHTSPLRNRGRIPRPVSMMGSLTRFTSSPTSKQPSRPSSMVNSPAAVSPGGYFSPRNVLELELEHPCNDADADSGLGESCSAKSPVTSSSRRSTLLSQTSTSPSAWGLPLPTSPVEGGATIRPIQKRKPRRFITGSTQLKPLLLPSMAAESTGLTSPRSPDRQAVFEEPASIDQTVFSYNLEGFSRSPKREISEQSLNPITSFLSQPFEDIKLEEHETTIVEPGSSPPLAPILHDFSFSSYVSAGLAVELNNTAYLHHEIVRDVDDETGAEEEEEEVNDGVKSSERTTLFCLERPQQTHVVFAEASPAQDIQSSPATQDLLISSIEALMHSSHPKHKPSESSYPRKRRRTSSTSTSQPGGTLLPPLWSDLDPLPTDSPPRSPPTLKPPDPNSNEPSQQQDRSSEWSFPDVEAMTLAAQASHQTPGSHLASPKRLPSPSTPLEILGRQSASSSPLTAVTIRSIYGTLSRYTTYVRDFKRDPLALARRVIANAWCSNWKRFGKFSWWVLGIFLPGGRRDFADALGWDWNHYDGEAVAAMVCRPETPAESITHQLAPPPSPSLGKQSVRFDDQCGRYRTHGSKKAARPALKGAKEKQTGLGKSLYLWGKFSVAIMMAIGGAVWQGPGEMLKDCDNSKAIAPSLRKPRTRFHHGAGQENAEVATSNDSPDVEKDAKSQPFSKCGQTLFTYGMNFDFSKTPWSPSSVFTFGATNDDNFWHHDNPEEELNHYHQPDYGEDEREIVGIP